MAAPRTRKRGREISKAATCPIPKTVNTQNATYIPNMISSPCAMLITRMTPKMMVSPIAITEYRLPTSSPFTIA